MIILIVSLKIWPENLYASQKLKKLFWNSALPISKRQPAAYSFFLIPHQFHPLLFQPEGPSHRPDIDNPCAIFGDIIINDDRSNNIWVQYSLKTCPSLLDCFRIHYYQYHWTDSYFLNWIFFFFEVLGSFYFRFFRNDRRCKLVEDSVFVDSYKSNKFWIVVFRLRSSKILDRKRYDISWKTD